MALKYVNPDGLLYFWQKILNKFIAKEAGKGLSSNDYTTAEKEKLRDLSNYELPTASADTKGGVKVGAGLAINNGVLSATGGGTADSVDWSNVQNRPDELADFNEDATHRTVTDDEKAAWNAKSDFSGSYKDLSDQPNIPASAADVGAVASTAVGVAGGVASLDESGKIPSTQLPSYVDDVVEGYLHDGVFYADTSYTDAYKGEDGKIYVDLDTNYTYRWGGTVYVQTNSSDMSPISNSEIDAIVASE